MPDDLWAPDLDDVALPENHERLDDAIPQLTRAGQLTWAQATREGRIQLDGLPSLVRAFPTWNARSMFAHIKPVFPASSAG